MKKSQLALSLKKNSDGVLIIKKDDGSDPDTVGYDKPAELAPKKKAAKKKAVVKKVAIKKPELEPEVDDTPSIPWEEQDLPDAMDDELTEKASTPNKKGKKNPG